MKKIFSFLVLAAVAATALVSCQQDIQGTIEPAAKGVNSFKFYAQSADALTKATLTPNEEETAFGAAWTGGDAMELSTEGYKTADGSTLFFNKTTGTTFSWTEGDQISVMCSDGQFRTFTAEKTAAASTFTGEVPENVTLGNYAFFPADDNHVYSGLKYNLPEYKDLTQHPSADLPMVGDKKDDGSYSFMHCTGASLFTLDNIPTNIVSVKVKFVSASLKLSGLFGVFKSSEEQWTWNAAAGSTDSEKTFSRKVSVNNGKAEIYLPYAPGAQMWANNTVSVTGYDSSNNEYTLVSGKTMKGTSSYTYARAHIQPLATLVLNNLMQINWNSISGYSGSGNYAEFKVTSDDYYVYFYSKVKYTAIKWGTSSGAGENGSYIYYGVDTDKNSSTGTDFWGSSGKFDSIVLVYPYDYGETIRTAPYVKVNGNRKSIECSGTIGSGEDAMVETSIAVLRSDLNVSKGTTVSVYSYASSNISQYSSEFEVML